MRILIAINEVQFGGAEICTELMVKELAKKGFCVDLITNSTMLIGRVCEVTNHCIHIDFNDSFFIVMKKMRKIDYTNYQVVISHKWDAAYLFRSFCSKYDIPLIAVVHSMYYQGLENERNMKCNMVDLFNNSCKAIITVSVACKNALIEQGVNEKLVTVLENVVVTNKTENNYCKNSTIITYVGRLSREKGVDLFIEAVSKCKKVYSDMVIKIVGEGPEEKTLKNLVIEKELHNIQFLGFRDNVEEILLESRFVVIPSRREAFSLVALEAKKLGVPVIAFNTGGLSENVKDKITGELIEHENIVALSNAIEKLYKDKELCLFYSENASVLNKKLQSVEEWSDKLLKIIEEAIEE